jgi:hypothetical protein
MPTVETLRSTADLALELDRIPDSAHVDWATAALLINTAAPPSRRTMERWRQGRSAGVRAADCHDLGPPFVPGVGRTARVTYNVGALRAWLRARGATSTMEVSARRGLTFTTLHDAWRDEPWIVSGERILGHALTVNENDLLTALQGNDDPTIEVLPLAAVMMDFMLDSAAARTPFQTVWETLLDDARSAARSREAESRLQSAVDRRAYVPSQGTCPKCGCISHGRLSPLNM